MGLRIVYGVICLLFLSFGAAQYNDPDGMTWVLLYGTVAVLFGYGVAGKHFKHFTLGALLLTTFAALLHFPGFIQFLTNDDGIGWSEGMSNAFPYIEQMREFGGLAITAGFLALLYFLSAKKSTS